jgi:hypothetical protein
MSQEIENLEKSIDGFRDILFFENTTKGPLWKAWHFMQVYSIWGTRLPNTEASLKLKLGISDPGAYSFFDGMLEAYQDVDGTCKFFLSDVFTGVTDLGNDLRSFADDASTDGGDIFSLIKEVIDMDDPQSALAVIADLQTTARENAAKAAEVKKDLATLQTRLEDAKGNLDTVKQGIESDSKTSQATIDKLSGGENVAGSLQNLTKLQEAKLDEYEYDVVVATTSLTYAWVFPVGTICAAFVAGFYGSYAVDALDEVEELNDKLAKAGKELQIAVSTHQVQQLAKSGVDNVLESTKLAIDQTTIIKNQWDQFNTNLGTISKKMNGLINRSGDLKNDVIINSYLKTATKKWEEILPALEDLTDDPYITVQDGEMTLTDLLQQVEQDLAVAA